MTAVLRNTWHKPAYDRHAHVSQTLAEILEAVPKAAIALCNHLFRVCIDGKLEEIELFMLKLGVNRSTEKRCGRPYSRNTLLEALRILVRLGLVIIDKSYGKGVFRLTINHPGKKRPFERFVRNPSGQSENCETHPKTDKTEGSNDVKSLPITEDIQKTAEPLDAAAPKNFFAQEEEEVARTESVVPEPTVATWKKKSAPPTEISVEGIDPDASSVNEETALVNTEEKEIVLALRDAGMLNPQLKALALSFTLLDVQAALTLYQQRQQKKEISNPQGFLTDCLRGQWWKEAKPNPTLAQSQFPAELVEWYELAEKAGIIDAIDLKHLPCYMGELSVRLLNRNRQRPFDPPFILTPWREAMALHPLKNLLDVGESDEAVEVPEEYKPGTVGNLDHPPPE